MHTHHGAVDEVALEDLSLYIQTTSQLYPRRQALQENIARRVENGTYDPGTAWKLALPLVNDGAHAYAREFPRGGNVFSRATREALAQRMAHNEYTEIVLQRQLGRDEAAYAGHLRDLERGRGRDGYGANETRYDAHLGRYGIWFNRVLDVLDKRGLDASITSSAVWRQLYNAEYTPEQAVDEVETTNEAVNDEAGEPRPWPRRSSAAREDGPGGSLRWIQTGDVYEAKAPLGGGKYVINVDPNNADGFQTWYLPVSKDDEAPMLGASTTLGGAMNLAKDHANAMAGVRRAAEGGAEASERVPVIHEGADVVAASVTTTETATVVTAKEDFKTAAMAEQHAYTEGFRYIAERGRKYDIYKRRPVGKKGYEKRELYHRRGKWHISGDKRFVSRLGRDARKILVDQGAKTIPIEHAAEGPKFERCVKSVKKRGEAVNPYAVCTTSVGQANESSSAPDLHNDKDFARIGPRDRVTIVDRFGVEHAGRAVMRGPHGWVLNMGGKHGTPAIASPENIVRVRKSKEAYEMAAESPRKNKVIGYVGDVNWSEYGGGPIYRTEHGEVLEYLDVSDEEDGKTLVYRVDLDPEVPSWGSIEDAARTSGQDVEELRKAFTSKDPFDRAYAYQTWAGHYGWHEFDSYPLELSKAEVNKRYFGTLQALKKLPRPHGYKWSASESRRKRGRYAAREGGAPGSGETFRAGGKDKAAREAYEAAQLKVIKGGKGVDKWQVGDDEFTQAYVFAALWSSTDDDGEPLEAKYEPKDLARSTLAQMEADCVTFQRENERDLNEAYGADVFVAGRRYDASSAGHDFWLTRNGHGAGFWDRGLGAVGDRLTKTAKGYGEADLYVGDDGKIYQAGAERAGRHGMHAVEEGGAEECAPCAAHEACEKHPKKRKDVDDTAEAVQEATNGACVAIVERVPGCVPTGIKMETARDVYDFMAPRYAKLGSECFFVLLVSNQGELLGAPIEIARGQPDRVAVDIEQIVAAAITGAAAGARGFLVSHGHPSGGEFARASAADKRLTQDIRDSARIACPSTAFLDHVIVAAPTTGGVGSYFSFEEKKVVKVNAPN